MQKQIGIEEAFRLLDTCKWNPGGTSRRADLRQYL